MRADAAKFVGFLSQSTALMDSLHASLCLIFLSLHLLPSYPLLFPCPLMLLDHCEQHHMLKWFCYANESPRISRLRLFPVFHPYLICIPPYNGTVVVRRFQIKWFPVYVLHLLHCLFFFFFFFSLILHS